MRGCSTMSDGYDDSKRDDFRRDSFSPKKDNNFALIVVLFVLLIIVGVSFVKKY
jgi:uncharacterized protein (TIGR01732 family)